MKKEKVKVNSMQNDLLDFICVPVIVRFRKKKIVFVHFCLRCCNKLIKLNLILFDSYSSLIFYLFSQLVRTIVYF